MCLWNFLVQNAVRMSSCGLCRTVELYLDLTICLCIMNSRGYLRDTLKYAYVVLLVDCWCIVRNQMLILSIPDRKSVV